MEFPEEKIEFECQWSLAAGQLSGLNRAVDEVEKRAAVAFINHRDEIANCLRDLAKELNSQVAMFSQNVQKYVEESRRRK